MPPVDEPEPSPAARLLLELVNLIVKAEVHNFVPISREWQREQHKLAERVVRELRS